MQQYLSSESWRDNKQVSRRPIESRFFFVELPLLLLINYQTLKDYRFLSSVYRSSKSFDSRRDIRELTGGGKSYLENNFSTKRRYWQTTFCLHCLTDSNKFTYLERFIVPLWEDVFIDKAATRNQVNYEIVIGAFWVRFMQLGSLVSVSRLYMLRNFSPT